MEHNKKTNIAGFNLTRQNVILSPELTECFLRVVEKGVFILGENVTALEDQIAAFCRVNHGIGVASGTDALVISLVANEIGPGDEVITTPFTFFATTGSIIRVGAKPVFVDIDPETWNIDTNLLEEKITPRTKAIVPVHLYGCPAEMNMITQIAQKYGLRIIEDAAQALGAKYREQMVGTCGDAGCFSFFPTKNLGSFGDGGMIVTGDAEIAERIKRLRVHGATSKYCHDILGYNSRLDELQAAILNVKCKYIEQWTQRRREIANLYTKLFQDAINTGKLMIKLPQEPDYGYHVYHQYTIQTDRRNRLQEYLHNWGIGSTVYYPIPMHLQKVCSFLGYDTGDFPVAEAACNEVLSLPMFPELTDGEAEVVVEKIVKFFAT
ncbi:MAG: DegT/DnrJ/EryC1/StrS family aminotransferase [Peptococcaceae bacterium]